MHALLIGASGATGKDLLDLLLKDNSFHQVDIFVRRDLDVQHEKLKIHIIDFDKPEQWKHLVKGDVLFSCLGTTLKAAGSKEAQWKVDYDYQYQFAKFAKENNVNNYVLVSSGFSSPNSVFFYTRMKGQLEEAVKDLGFPKLSIFNPPVLIRKNSDRTMEVAGLKAIQFFNKIEIFRSQKPLLTEILAQAMINSSKTKENGIFTLEGKGIWKRAQANYENKYD
ncbi:semialdehyde dehydrogenase [Bacillus sp. AFS076308]|uniref:NAD(P)H-binding protein n=1 Tax=unclassified Bacillus (in: firmicutes) TaxID=185979 RepID=UPI000BF8EC9A|nr:MULTISPECIES: NAD(P)H-binding protein [unclassified Bacillus (in: firmicutes)]PFO06619.1 semialdehyde dehydrogenase [Bacillus sp. AFS076308]PGV52828.1 semialdehyde dehydrogenase [Bacillus sp. AFS037270]